MIKLFSSLKFLSILIILISFATYFNIFGNQLFFDDEELIYKNAYVKDIKYFPRYFTTNMIAGAGKISNMYRPILITSFAIDHLIWGDNPFGYHLTSIVLHGSNGVLVMILLYLLFGNKIIAFFTSLLFIIHPVQSEAVSYASGRTDPLYTFFVLLSIIFFLWYLKTGFKKISFYFISILTFLFGILSKESAIIAVVLLPLSIFVYNQHKNKFHPPKLWLFLPYICLAVIYIILRLTILNFIDTLNFYTGLSLIGQNAQYSQNVLARLFTFSKVFFEYLSILFFPKDLIIARSVQIITTVWNIWTICFISIVIFSIIFLLKKKADRIYLFGLLWLLISLIPSSGLVPINNIMAEHYLYLPSTGLFLILSGIFYRSYFILKNKIPKWFMLLFLILVAISLSIRTIIRTFDWRDPITFYTLSLNQSPQNIPMRHNLAMAYQDKGNINHAIEEYRKIIENQDIYPNTHHNLANAYKAIGRYKEAEEEYYKALDKDSGFYFSLYGLAELYQQTGEKGKLNKVLEQLNKKSF